MGPSHGVTRMSFPTRLPWAWSLTKMFEEQNPGDFCFQRFLLPPCTLWKGNQTTGPERSRARALPTNSQLGELPVRSPRTFSPEVMTA